MAFYLYIFAYCNLCYTESKYMSFPCSTLDYMLHHGAYQETVLEHFPPCSNVCSLILLHHVIDFHYLWQVLLKQSVLMESPEFSLLSSLRGEFKSEDYIQPHYKESYRLAVDHLVTGGRDSYLEFLKGERIGNFLSEEELVFITENAEKLPHQNNAEEINGPDCPQDNQSSSGTYWPIHSDVDTPDLELGWPEIMHEKLQTNIDLLFHPPRLNNPTIKEVIRKQIQQARQVIKTACDSVPVFRQIKLCLRATNRLRCTLVCSVWGLCSSDICHKHHSPSRQFLRPCCTQLPVVRSVCWGCRGQNLVLQLTLMRRLCGNHIHVLALHYWVMSFAQCLSWFSYCVIMNHKLVL